MSNCIENGFYFYYVISFSRLIDTGDTLQDKTLNASYYLLYAAVNTPPGTVLIISNLILFVPYCYCSMALRWF